MRAKSQITACTLCLLLLLVFCLPAFAGWTPAERISDECTVYNPRIASNNNYLHVVYTKHYLTNYVYYLRSIDRGINWDAPFLMPDTVLTSGNIKPIIQVKGDTICSLWSNYFRGGGGRNITFRKSTNSGQTWQSPVYILPSNNLELQKHTMCVSESDIYVVFSHSGNGLRFEFTKSTNWGQTWIEPEEIFTADDSGRFDMACRGDTVHFFWSGKFDSNVLWEIYYTKSVDGGDNWSENYLISEYDTIGSQYPSVSINESGEMVVCWLDGKYSSHPWNGDLFVRYSRDSGDNWTEEEQITFTHWAVDPRVIWHDDSIHVTWEDDRYGQEDIFYMLSTDSGLSWGEEQRVDDEPARSESPDIAISGENRFIVWNDRRYDPGPGVYLCRWEPGVSIEETNNNTLPEDIVFQAYPNPFNSKIIISCSNLKGGGIEIYDITGKLVKQIHSGGSKEGKVTWDAIDAFGEKITSGIYFVRARTPQDSQTLKLVYLK